MKELMKKPAKEFMTKEVISVKDSDDIKKVFKLMDEYGILGLPVVSDDKGVIGIVTEADLIKHFTKLNSPMAISILGSLVYLENTQDFNENLKDHCAEIVKDIMTDDVTTVMEETTLEEAINIMSKDEVSRLPVVNIKGELTGIITRSDIVHEIAKLKTI